MFSVSVFRLEPYPKIPEVLKPRREHMHFDGEDGSVGLRLLLVALLAKRVKSDMPLEAVYSVCTRQTNHSEVSPSHIIMLYVWRSSNVHGGALFHWVHCIFLTAAKKKSESS